MKKVIIATIFVFFFVSKVFATNIANQTITITIEPIAVIAIGDGKSNQTWLTVDEAGVATGSNTVKWTTNLENLSVCIQSNLASEQQSNLLQVRVAPH